MIYIDSSVLLADLFVEAQAPRQTLWEEDLASSRLLAFEVWTRINARNLINSHGDRARGLLARVNLTEMTEDVLERALEPFPIAVRTLDALHLATMAYHRGQGEPVELASYDGRLLAAARALSIPLAAL
ncbi:MAG: PIN domain-containing protein [Stellaceae bacterium]